jgi:hypothetical protein
MLLWSALSAKRFLRVLNTETRQFYSDEIGQNRPFYTYRKFLAYLSNLVQDEALVQKLKEEKREFALSLKVDNSRSRSFADSEKYLAVKSSGSIISEDITVDKDVSLILEAFGEDLSNARLLNYGWANTKETDTHNGTSNAVACLVGRICAILSRVVSICFIVDDIQWKDPSKRLRLQLRLRL